MPGRHGRHRCASADGARSGASISCRSPCRRPEGAAAKTAGTICPNPGGEGWDACAAPWSGTISVLVISRDQRAFPTAAMPRHERDRRDAENGFEELRKMHGGIGYASRRLVSSGLMSNLVALF
ncbi:MAG: hypothetical protein KGR69_05365 [Verrucomicrobia bacterium]|nr:hypothetical protein [Verrucomicrobiota bacterium]